MAIKKKLTFNDAANAWTAQEAAAWSEIPYRVLLRMFKSGEAPCLRLGDPQKQNMGTGRQKRRRTCGRFLVPRAAFVTWFETLAPTAQNADHQRIA
jgi:hypothetical protein